METYETDSLPQPDSLCYACGACCLRGTIIPLHSPEEIEQVGGDEPITGHVEKLSMDTTGFLGGDHNLYVFRKDCINLGDNRNCSEYGVRPVACQAFVAGGEECGKARQSIGLHPVIELGTTRLAEELPPET